MRNDLQEVINNNTGEVINMINIRNWAKLLETATVELRNFELTLFSYALSQGGDIVISKKTMQKITGTGVQNVYLQLKKVDFKGLAELDHVDSVVYTLKINGIEEL
ncbi:hypothetical protein [Clostridium tyrobutyricum]|uniref:hypothetical protein n=1 Tax=Clostridium tyrobutyricum TaxID=1519 RepID=UPI001C3859E7|nr:hypothetical protein [Clostridium tyrobutyricum]MBV4429075.1 hypothetical protein [Clostridium tyrobutyricum]MBV4444152.1 hypothetical protein [Clostridium tyrobutyricum]